jgi:hypothetical protein
MTLMPIALAAVDNDGGKLSKGKTGILSHFKMMTPQQRTRRSRTTAPTMKLNHRTS